MNNLAAEWFRNAAMQSDAPGQYFLGMLLQRGAGLPRDHEEARLWLSRAAEQGHPLASWELAQAHELGIGVTVDNERALRYYEAAAVANKFEAIKRMQRVYRDGELEQAANAGLAAFWRLKLNIALRAASLRARINPARAIPGRRPASARTRWTWAA